MTDRAAFSGSYADFKIIRTRKVCQVVIELPLEQGGAFVEAFGLPDPGAEVPVAIARLNTKPTKPAMPGEEPLWTKVPLASQAGIRCQEWGFRRFLKNKDLPVKDEQSAAQVVRTLCRVKSRRELNDNEIAAQKWREIETEYQQWCRRTFAL